MNFFTSPEDLRSWIKTNKTAAEACQKIIDVVGKDDELDIIQTCNAVFEDKDGNASKILFEILGKYNFTQKREGKMKEKIIKEAQMMRQDSVYGNMEMRICPKLPYSVGKRLISTYNCRHYCIDSITLDDDPERVYCAEALWRRHVMDKFSREFKDKDGKWVGGYINDRFQVFHDAAGNQMELANGERTRKPRPHQFSTERRLEEARGEKTTDLEASSNKFVKLASVEKIQDDSKIYQIFDDIIEMKESGLSDEDIIYKVSEHYGENIVKIASVYKIATKLLQRHNGIIYSHDHKNTIKTAQVVLPEEGATMVSEVDLDIISLNGNQNSKLNAGTPVVVVSNKNNDVIFQIASGSNERFRLKNITDIGVLSSMDDPVEGKIQEGASDLGLNENEDEEFPVVEI